ncbi:MAG: hypothetical protein WAM69_05605 [Candidatus Sulfotelmatobacter sp.]
MSITSKSSDVYEAKDTTVFPRATTEIATLTAPKTTTTSAGQRTEQMYELAEIFASIFEALPNEHEHAIADAPKAA